MHTSPPTHFRRTIAALLLLSVLLLLPCVSAEEPDLTRDWSVSEDQEFGALCIDCTPEEFFQAGFALGDSCDVELSNGYHLEDVPVYDGFYGRSGTPVIVLYPGYEGPHFTFCTTGDLWTLSGATLSDTVRVTLRERGKYLAVQQSLSMVYSNDRADYPSDAAFANFRALSGGKLRAGFFLRGASPVDNKYSRAAAADGLLREYGIGFVLDLADTRERAEGYDTYAGSLSAELAAEGKVTFLGLTAAFMSKDYGTALVAGLRTMMEQDGPVYIHCTEGKDRTGFVCILLEALAGADYEELAADYMASYQNYYGLTRDSDPEKYDAVLEVKFQDILCQLTGETEFIGGTLEAAAQEYLARFGMTRAEIDRLTRYLTEA